MTLNKIDGPYEWIVKFVFLFKKIKHDLYKVNESLYTKLNCFPVF